MRPVGVGIDQLQVNYWMTFVQIVHWDEGKRRNGRESEVTTWVRRQYVEMEGPGGNEDEEGARTWVQEGEHAKHYIRTYNTSITHKYHEGE